MFKEKLNYRIINLAALMIFLYVLFANINLWWNILVKIFTVLSPFVIGFAFAYALTPLVHFLEGKKVPRTVALLIVIFGLIIVVGSIMAITLPMVYDQLHLLIRMLIEVFDNISTKFNINIGSFEIKITDYLNAALQDIGSITSSTTVDIFNKSINFISKFIVGFVGFIYFLVDMDKIREFLKDLFNSWSKRFYHYVNLMDVEITNYLKGLEIFMVIQFIEYSFLFLIIGHPNWLILGILACVMTIIPYFGGLITNIIAIILASVVSLPLMISTTIICLIFPQVDGYIISPRVYGKTNNVNPFITIIVVSVGGTIFGVWGIIIALPCYLLVRTTYIYFKKDLRKGVNLVKENI